MKTLSFFRIPGRIFFFSIVFFILNSPVFSQIKKNEAATFGLRPAFYFPEYHLPTYPALAETDPWTHTFRFPASRVPGTLTSLLAYTMYYDYLAGSDTSTVMMQRKDLNEAEREALFRLNQQVWNTYYSDWRKQSKAQLYQVDLEGIIRGAMTKPMW